MNYRSEQTNEIFGALSKAQGEMEVAGLTSANPFFKSRYADLTELVKASRPALVKYGLGVTQTIETDENDADFVLTTLTHSSGQYTASRVKMRPSKSDVQAWGSCLSYLQRYSYKAIVGITTGEDDDDGEAAVAESRKPNYIPPKHIEKPSVPVFVEKINTVQLQDIQKLFDGRQDKENRFLAAKNLASLADIPQSRYLSFYKEIEAVFNGEESAKNKA